MTRRSILWNWGLAVAWTSAVWIAGAWRTAVEVPRPWPDPAWPLPRGSYHDGSGDETNHEIWTLLASPTLFALPSEIGFSRLPLGESPVSPPVQSPVPDAPVLPRAPGSWSFRPESLLGDLIVVAEPAGELPGYPVSRRSVLTLIVVEGPTPAQGSPVARPWKSTHARPRPWSADLRLHVAPEGWPVQLFMESGDIPAQDGEALVRELARWRWAPTPTDTIVRVHATFAPVVEEDSP